MEEVVVVSMMPIVASRIPAQIASGRTKQHRRSHRRKSVDARMKRRHQIIVGTRLHAHAHSGDVIDRVSRVLVAGVGGRPGGAGTSQAARGTAAVPSVRRPVAISHAPIHLACLPRSYPDPVPMLSVVEVSVDEQTDDLVAGRCGWRRRRRPSGPTQTTRRDDRDRREETIPQTRKTNTGMRRRNENKEKRQDNCRIYHNNAPLLTMQFDCAKCLIKQNKLG